MKTIRKTFLEFKILGLNFFVPFLILIAIFVVNAFMSNYKLGLDFTLNTYQIFIPFFAAWWSIFILYELLEQDGGELLLSCNSNKIKLGILSNLKFYLIYMAVSNLLIIANLFLFYDLFNVYFLLQIAFKCLFVSSFSFFIMVLIKNSGWSIFCIIVYVFYCLCFL